MREPAIAPSPVAALLAARRFLPLFVCQFLGALNDNLFKAALSILITFRLAGSGDGLDGPTLVMLAGALFIAPFFLFSAFSGGLADRVDKARIARWVKLAEIAIMAIGAAGLILESVALLLAALFLLGTHSTVFGPIKYAILPQHLAPAELVAGNALIEAGTFLAILIGTILGSGLVLTPGGGWTVAAIGLVAGLGGWLAARAIPPAPASAQDAPPRLNLVADTVELVRYALARPALAGPVLGISWFWMVGATFVSGLAPFARDGLGADEHVVTLMLVVFAIGVGLGSLLCERVLRGDLHARPVPLAGIALALFAIDLHLASGERAPGDALAGIGAFLAQAANWRVLGDLLGLAVAGGVFTVPLYALVQAASEPSHRARVIAANNVVNALGMTAAAGVAAALLAAGFAIRTVFLVCGLATLAVSLVALWLLRWDLLKALIRLALRLAWRVRLEGMEHVTQAGPRAVIAPNHASFLDGVLLAAFLPGRPVFAIDTHVARRWWMRPFLHLFDAMPVDPANPLSIRAMIRAVESGKRCVIFPEGRITTTGALMKVYEGPAVIAEKARAPLVPVRLEGVELTPFSRLGGKIRRRWFPSITITAFAPRMVEAPAGVVGRARRAALKTTLREQMIDAAFATADLDRTLPQAILDARDVHGGGHLVLDDIDQKPMSYDGLLRAAFALGRALAERTGPSERVGLLLPTSRAAVASFVALQVEGRVPAMLNFTAGSAGLDAALTAAEIRLVVTARRFVEQAKLGALVDGLAERATVLFLEDVRAEIGLPARLGALLASWFPRAAINRRAAATPDDPAVVLFTSGSEGTPKGVVLSHRNLLANRHQLGAVLDFSPRDVVLDALPLFHSFGLTGGLLLPLLTGVRTFLYPSPLHYRIVPEIAYGINATILFGTDTFLAGYARVADPWDFYSVRYVFAGAERVKPETRQAWFDKFGIRLLEGYGATETSPALAVNTPAAFKAGTVGRLLPGIEHRLDPVPGIDEGGRLVVNGPNVMLGYLRAEKPGALEPPPDGWYDTGDIVAIDGAGFVTIKGRAKRFAKVAGEMVPLDAVEELARRTWPGVGHAVVAVPDAKRGEQLVLVTERQDASRAALVSAAQQAGLPELFVPRVVVPVDKLPLLGTGKTDYVAVAARLRDAGGAAVAPPAPIP